MLKFVKQYCSAVERVPACQDNTPSTRPLVQMAYQSYSKAKIKSIRTIVQERTNSMTEHRPPYHATSHTPEQQPHRSDPTLSQHHMDGTTTRDIILLLPMLAVP